MNTVFSADTLVLLAGLTYVLGYLTINQVVLRLLVLLGTGFYIWYYAIAADAPLWAAIWMSLAIGAATLFGLIALLGRKTKFMIPDSHKDVYPKFHGMVPGDFRSLVLSGTRRKVDEDTVITVEGEDVRKLMFIVNGTMTAQKKGVAFSLPKDIFVGEVAYLRGQVSSATTTLHAGAEIIEWDIAHLRRKSRRSARFKMALEAVISNDLALKVAHAVALERTTV